ncbi:DinB family protein [Glycomyces sp. TRM65418]|uniref:DinB family protein n=1 Tax=Glycomyces sp. TRM65418 TaxID=2867006 RepID=UPI001CE63A43|nr:DinB family protein [Glycomyces sp. TRM65418]MCC3763257.1 DinB family protein [Glycomyces sp. TRM65418]QZD57258.1 DinB family protein [Glycomyces sp. TRM65418]
MTDLKTHLHRYLQAGRDAVLWKLEGLGEYDVRRPLTPTGTNLLGLVKHLASNEAGYFGDVFARPFPEPMPWVDDADDSNADMWAAPDQSRDYITGLYRQVWEHADATIRDLDLDATGTVPWWPTERATVTLGQIIAHMIAETHRHAGHADITREGIDGAVGLRQGNDNMAHSDQPSRTAFRDRVEQAAREAAGI